MRTVAGIGALVALLVAAVAVPSAPGSTDAGCEHGQAPRVTLSIDGNLYAVVRGEHDRTLFGASGPPVLSFPQAFRLIRKLGFEGTNAQLLRRLSNGGLPGVAFADGGGSSGFYFTCSGSYRTTAVVRLEGRSITGTRFWLRQGSQGDARAFCMPAQWVPAGALVSVSFRVPLGRAAPVFTIDWDGNGTVDSVGPFQAGGAGFRASQRC